MTTHEALRGNWNTIVGAVKEKFGQITGDDLAKVEGNLDQFVGLLQRKTGQTRQQVEAFMEECCSGASGYLYSAAETAANAATQASRYIADGYKHATDEAERGYDYARKTVERRPLESVALVAGASLLAGVLLGISLGNRR